LTAQSQESGQSVLHYFIVLENTMRSYRCCASQLDPKNGKQHDKLRITNAQDCTKQKFIAEGK